MQEVAADLGDGKIPSTVVVGTFPAVHAHGTQNAGVNAVDGHGLFYCLEADLIRGTAGRSAFDGVASNAPPQRPYRFVEDHRPFDVLELLHRISRLPLEDRERLEIGGDANHRFTHPSGQHLFES